MSFNEHHLRMVNAQLREEVQRLSRMVDNQATNSSNTNILSRNNMPLHDEEVSNYEVHGEDGMAMDLPTSPKDDKIRILGIAFEAMEELTMLASAGSTLWLPQNNQHGTEILNEDEYFKTFPKGTGPKLFGYKSESSRDFAIILMNHINLIEILMNVKQWSNMFCGIVSRASTIEFLSAGVNGNYNGALEVWDVLCRTGQVEKNAHISNGHEQGNCISLIQVNKSQNANHNMFILQESCTDCTGSYVVYAPIGINPMHKILSGGEQDCIGLLPSGFAILPFVPNLSPSPLGGSMLDDGSEGSLITVAFQILVDNNPTAKLSHDSVKNVESFLKFSVQKIKNAVMSYVNTHFLNLPT
ncbi:unnamed protein product [Lupinus luteus]|uniref:START domain-containing protein n=1 Tax=Lupinus luteus TaxID=3873 RepID=A0AAV1XJ21_LUPLU